MIVIDIIAHPSDPEKLSSKNIIALYIGAYTNAVNILKIAHLFFTSKLETIGTSSE